MQLLFARLALLLALAVAATLAADLSAEGFAELLADERVAVVEFYSAMCGSCKEFEPHWAETEKKLKSIATAKVNIDTPEGMKIAQSQKGLLEDGIPAVRLFASKSSVSVGIVKGEVKKSKEVVAAIRAKVSHLNRRDDGMFLKSA